MDYLLQLLGIKNQQQPGGGLNIPPAAPQSISPQQAQQLPYPQMNPFMVNGDPRTANPYASALRPLGEFLNKYLQ